MIEIRHAAVIGATGATGRSIVAALRARGESVRAVSRCEKNLNRAFPQPEIEKLKGNIESEEDCRRAIGGCEVVFDCVGFPLREFQRHVTSARTLTQAAREAGARVTLVTGYWSFAPSETPISDQSPARASNRYSKIRIEQEKIVRGEGGMALVLPDFFGPFVGAGVLNDAIALVVRRGAVLWPGDPRAERDFLFVPDCALPAVELSLREEASGQRWILAGSGLATPNDLLRRAALMMHGSEGDSASRGRVRVRRIPPDVLAFASVFRRDLRAFAPIAPIYYAAARFDDSRTRDLIGDWPRTSYDDGLRATLAWIRSRST